MVPEFDRGIDDPFIMLPFFPHVTSLHKENGESLPQKDPAADR